MALTFTRTATDIAGSRQIVEGYLSFDSSYPTGGEAVTAGLFGLSRIDLVQVNPAGGFAFQWDGSNSKIIARTSLHTVSATITKAAATDGGSTTGLQDFATGAVPAGAIIRGWKAVTTVAWSGDTSATIMVGVSGDTDRFSADTTQSIFTTGTVGSAPIAADVAKGIGSAVTPRVTITSASDFTNTNALASTLVSVYFEIPGGLSECPDTTDLSALTIVRTRVVGV